jgi:phage tail-like protein
MIADLELGFASVSQLTSETDPETPPGRPANRHAPVVLRRSISTDRALFDWRRRVVDGKDDRRDVTILQLSAPGGEVVNAWKLVGARPSRWSGPAFDALHDDIAMEEIELTYDDLVWLDERKPPMDG